MQYLGGKSKLAKHIAPFLVKALDEIPSRTFVEPFVGGFNIVPALTPRPEVIICNDAHPGLRPLYEAVRDGWDPPKELDEPTYHALRANWTWDMPTVAFAAFGCSFGGKEWGGYARNSRGDDFVSQARRGLLKKRPAMQKVHFTTLNYTELQIAPGSVVYCDPPYAGTTQYKIAIEPEEFAEWCRKLHSNYCAVFISEFQVLDGTEVVWQHARNIQIGSRGAATEYLLRVV